MESAARITTALLRSRARVKLAVMELRLARRREIWLPTGLGWLLLLGIVGAALAAALRFLYPYLAVTEPVGAPIAVVEGWLDPGELDEAAAAIRQGGYRMVVTTGGPLHLWPRSADDGTFAGRAAEYLRSRGVGPLVAAPSPITHDNRTYKSALMVRDWARRSGIRVERLDIYSRGPHARRSRHFYRLAFRDADVGVVALRPDGYDPARWWRSSAGAREVLEQATGLVWTFCFFRPAV